MLQPALAALLEVAVHRRHVVACLDQFNLDESGIGQRHRVVGFVGFALVAIVPDRDLRVVVPRTDGAIRICSPENALRLSFSGEQTRIPVQIACGKPEIGWKSRVDDGRKGRRYFGHGG